MWFSWIWYNCIQFGSEDKSTYSTKSRCTKFWENLPIHHRTAPPKIHTLIYVSQCYTIVGGWTTHPKNMLVKLGIIPEVRGENTAKKIFELPPLSFRYFCSNLTLRHQLHNSTRFNSSTVLTPEALLASVNISTSCIGHNSWKAHPCTCPKESTQLQVKDLQGTILDPRHLPWKNTVLIG